MYVSNKGFTLSELLVTLSVLGLIAALTIPSIYNGIEESRKKAVFKDAISAITTAFNEGLMEGVLPANNFATTLLPKLNCARTCPNDAAAEGCWDVAVQGTSHWINQGGCILPSGARIIGFRHSEGWPSKMEIDYNGVAGPNTFGEDKLRIVLCQDASCPPFATHRFGEPRAGRIGPVNDSDIHDPNLELYVEIFE